jgi:hypothetical protein
MLENPPCRTQYTSGHTLHARQGVPSLFVAWQRRASIAKSEYIPFGYPLGKVALKSVEFKFLSLGHAVCKKRQLLWRGNSGKPSLFQGNFRVCGSRV